MVGVFNNVSVGFDSLFNSSLALDVLVLSIVLAVVSLFIWKFYRSTSKKSLIKLDLQKYNYSIHPFWSKLIAMVLYLLEYIIVTPLLLMLWYSGLAIVLLLIGGATQKTSDLLLIAAIVIGAIRILAYFKGEISKDLAKLFPFIALSTFLFSIADPHLVSEGIFIKISEIPAFLTNGVVFSYLSVVFLIEIILRVFYTLYDFWKSEGGREEIISEIKKQKMVEEDKDK